MTCSKTSEVFLACQANASLAYQRPYAWSRDHIQRLFEDLSHGVDELRSSPNAISFLGTVITIHDTTYATVEPQVQGFRPES